MDISEGLRTLAAKAKEWGHKIIIASMKITAAFDFMRFTTIHRLLLEQGATEAGATAWLRENVAMEGHINIAGVACSKPVELRKGCTQ